MNASRVRFSPEESARAVRCLLFLVLLLATARPSLGQEEPARRVFLDRIDVSLVNVEVMVMDGRNPVRGLTRDDFVIYDDGEPVEITNFYEVEGGFRRRQLQEGLPPEEAATEVARERSFIIILVDNTFIDPPQRKQIFAALGEQLDHLLFEGAEVMVVDKDRQVLIEQRFTSDRAAIDAALRRIQKKGAITGGRVGSERMLLRQIARGTPAGANAGPGDAAMLLWQVHGHASEVFQAARRSTLTLRSFLNSLAGLPGRKALIYVADGYPLRAGELVFRAWWNKYGASSAEGVTSVEEALQEYDTSQELVDLIADASANRVAFYPLASGTTPVLSAGSAARGDADNTASFALMNQAPETQGLRLLARGTGGWVATEIANFDRALGQLEEDLTGYYSLGFPSRHQGDGKVHEIRVMVKRPGVELRYLESYRDKGPDDRMVDRTLSAVLMEEDSNPLQVEVEIGEIEREKKNRFIVPFEIKFPIAKLTLVPQEQSLVGSVSIFVVVRDEEGQVSEPQKIPLALNLPPESMTGSMPGNAAYASRIRVRPGEQVLGIGVRDDLANLGSTVNVKVEVGADR